MATPRRCSRRGSTSPANSDSCVLCVCDEDSIASERVIIKNGGIFENRLYDDEEKVFVKRYWIDL